MRSSTGRFSRARPDKPTSKKVRGFLALPGEVRNQIYGYYFETEVRCEIAAKGARFERAKSQLAIPRPDACSTEAWQKMRYVPELPLLTLRISRPLGKYTMIHGLQTNWSTSPFALTLLCKQIHFETQTFLYQTPLFVFNAPKRLTNFLATISSPKLECITKLQLHYETYGHPVLDADRIWQTKHNESWTRACRTASRCMKNLRELGIWLRVVDIPLRMDLHQPWFQPLQQFCRLSRPCQRGRTCTGSENPVQESGKLQCVTVHFSSMAGTWFPGTRRPVDVASRDLHGLFARAVQLAILGADEDRAMTPFLSAWEGEHKVWQHHLGYGSTGW